MGDSGLLRGALRLSSANPDTALDLMKPRITVVPEGGANLDTPNLEPTTGIFVSNLRFAPEGDGFVQSMDVEWIGDLEILAGRPGCSAIAARCDANGCSSG